VLGAGASLRDAQSRCVSKDVTFTKVPMR